MSSNGTIEITATGLNETTVTASIKVKAFYLITFEDVDAKYLAGPTAYGDNLYTNYTGSTRNYIKAIMTYLPICFSIQRPKDMVLHLEELPSRNGITRQKLTI